MPKNSRKFNQRGAVSAQSALLVGALATSTLVGGLAYVGSQSSATAVSAGDSMCVSAEYVGNSKINSYKGDCVIETPTPTSTDSVAASPSPTVSASASPTTTAPTSTPVVTPTPTPTPTVEAPSIGTNASVTNLRNTAVDASNVRSIVTSVDGLRLAAHTDKKVYVSDNAGQTWKLTNDISTSIAGVNRYFASIASSKDGSKVVIGPGNSGSAESLYVYKVSLLTQNYVSASGLNYGDVGTFLSMESSDDGGKMIALRSDGFVWKSVNGGGTWTKGQSVNASNYSGGVNKIAMSADGTKLVAVGNGSVWNSTDSGTTWTKKVQPSQKWTSIDTDSSGSKWFATVQGGKVYYSTDMGATWTPYDILGVSANWSSISTSSDGKVIIVGKSISKGELFFSIDGGETWKTSSATEGFGYWNVIKISPDGKRFFAQSSTTIKTGIIE